MGTLELRITAVKPGVDGKLVRVMSLNYTFKPFLSKIRLKNVFRLFFSLSPVDSQSPDLSCAAPVTLFTSERVRTPAPPS